MTPYRWCREKKGTKKVENPKGGQRKPREIRELVIEIAKTTGFGYTRIIGELRKLGIKNISRQTVRNILKEEGIQPGPDRTSDCWDNFVKRHAETLWGCDFFSVKTVTKRGLKDMYVLVFLCLETREAIVSPSTEHPNMERDHLPPIRETPDEIDTLPLEQIEVRSYVGGLVRSFERKVA